MKKFLCVAMILAISVNCIFANGSKESVPTSNKSMEQPAWEEFGTPLSDVRVRQALRYAIDMDTIVDTLFDGKAEVAKSLIPPGPYLSDDIMTYNYNPEKAKELLKEAQWPSDYTLDVVYYYGDQQTVDLMSVIQQYWLAVGVKSSFRKLEGDLGSQLWLAPEDRVNGPSVIKWDLAYAAIAALSNDEFINRFTSKAVNNSTLPYVEGLDELIDGAVTLDITKQKQAFYSVEETMADNMYIMPLYHQLLFTFTSDKIDTKGTEFGNGQYPYNKNILNWTTSRSDKTLYTNGGPEEFFYYQVVNPGVSLYQELVFDRLINTDASLTPTEGLLAKSYNVSKDGKTITLNLRDDVKWHDGMPFTAEDVKFTIELLIRCPGLHSNAFATFNSLEGAKEFKDGASKGISGIMIDGNTVTLKFAKIDPNALLTLSQWAILPKHLLEGANPITLQQNSFWQNPVGTGPFKVGTVNMGNYCILDKNKDYFQKGTGNIEKVYLSSSYENDANLVKNAEAGRIDYGYTKSVDDVNGVAAIEGMKIIPVNIRYTRLFFMNQYPHPANID
jgi:peptide/nickel transport system substrate-binding protein